MDRPRPTAALASERGETWNDRDAIAAHRLLTPEQRWELTVQASRAALLFASAERVDHDDAVRA